MMMGLEYQKATQRGVSPFVRLDQSRNAETGGTGLGLTIARDVARVHGGDLFLETCPMAVYVPVFTYRYRLKYLNDQVSYFISYP